MNENYYKLKIRQALPLEQKIHLTKKRITDWYNHFAGDVYVSFSGGKDSTVLLHIARELYPNIEAVFCDTGLEFPEIKDFVKTIDNVTYLKPKMGFKDVLEKFGFPLISKEQSQYIYQYRHAKDDRTRDLRIKGDKNGNFRISNKWIKLIHAPFMVSDKCCDVMKKDPFKRYEKKSNKKPIIGIMASESFLREQQYTEHGCNAFNLKRPTSKPLSFWNDEDVWQYLKINNVPYSKIYDMGYKRTGCMFCLFGIHLENEPNRFQKMQKTHPKIHEFCLNKLGLKEVLDYIGVPYKEQQMSLFKDTPTDNYQNKKD